MKMENEEEDNQDPMVAIAKAEERAQAEQKKNPQKTFLGSNRHYATLLHREADQLHMRGDYEAALVLYHKAASICPRDSSHSVAARRTTAAISSAAYPSPALRKLLPKARNGAEFSATLCPEAAAIRAENILKQANDPSSIIPELLQYFDGKKDFWKMSSGSFHKISARFTRSQIMQKQLSIQAEASLRSLTSFFNAGDFKSTLKIGQELISLASGLQNPHRYLVEAYNYLALIHVSTRRHDRALNNVSQMIITAKASGNSALFTKSLVTLGVVHLSFGHVEAVCRAWEWLFPELEDLVPQAWLLHEIGRCHFDSGRYSKSLKLALQTQEIAEEANSKKWYLHGKLLSGQSLLKLGRYGEALEPLKIAAELSRKEGDNTYSYIQDLVNEVSKVLRMGLKLGAFLKGKLVDSPDRKVAYIERKALEDYKDTLMKKPDSSVTARTYILETDFDPDSVRTTNTNSTYTVRNPVKVGTTLNSLDVSEMGDTELKNLLTEPWVIEKQLKMSKVLLKLEREIESGILRTLSEVGESEGLKARDEEEVGLSPSVELLSKDLDERISLNACSESGNEESESPEKYIEVDTDWRLDFVRSHEDEDLVDATESIQSGRTYGFVATHALCRHSLPSSPRSEKNNEKSPKTFEGFRTSSDPF